MTSVDEPRPTWVNAFRYCRWPDCGAPRSDDPEAPPLCMPHIIRAAKYLADLYGRSVIDPMNESRRPAIEAAQDAADGRSVVYYVRLGDHVKIGTTTRLTERMYSFHANADQLLATEPGGRQLERERHAQFRAERVYSNRELFNPSPRLLAHIDTLREVAA